MRLASGCLCFAVLLSMVRPARAQSGDAVDFMSALGLAAESPSVDGARRALGAKRAGDSHISGITFNPQLSVQPGYRVSPTPNREAEVVVEVYQPFSVTGHGGARRAAARAEERALAMEVLAQSLTKRLGAARSWIDVASAERVLALTRREEEIAAELQRLVERLAKAGEATNADVLDARAFHSDVKLQALASEGDVHDRGLELARELGRATMVPVSTKGLLPDIPLPAGSDLRLVLDRLQRLPSVQLRTLLARAEQARGVEERAARGTVMHLGAVVQRDAPGGLVLSGLVRVTPAIFDRGEREHATLAASAARLEGEARTEQVEATVQLGMATHEVEHTRELVDELRAQLVPATRDAARARRKIFDAGEATLYEVLQAERAALMAEVRLETTTAAHSWARVRTWLLLASMQEAP